MSNIEPQERTAPTTFYLADFETTLRYSIVAGKSFLCFSKFGDAPEQVIVRAIKRVLHGSEVTFRCSVLEDVTEESLQEARTASPSSPSSSITARRNDNDKVDDVALDIKIINNINELSRDGQTLLVKHMRLYPSVYRADGSLNETGLSNTTTHIFIGIVDWVAPSDEDTISNSGTNNKVITQCLKIDPWLRNKLWCSCRMPDFDMESPKSLQVSSESSISDEGEEVGKKGEARETESDNFKGLNIDKIRKSLAGVHLESSLRRYVLDIMVHLRMHRLIYHGKGGGVGTDALADVLLLAKFISLDLGNPYVTPREIKKACRWYFPMHLILISKPSQDTTLLYGSKLSLVQDFVNSIVRVAEIKSGDMETPLFLESLVTDNVLSKVIPPM